MIIDYKLELSDITCDRISYGSSIFIVRQCVRYLLVIDGVERQTTMDTLTELMYNNKHELQKSIKDMLSTANANVQEYIKEKKLKCLSTDNVKYITSTCVSCKCVAI